MLDVLDLLIGFAFVMMVLSTGVTLLTQLVSNAINLRGRALLHGLTALFRQIQPTLSVEDAAALALVVLRDPTVAGPPGSLARLLYWILGSHSWTVVRCLGLGIGNVISREELIQVLLARGRDKNLAIAPTLAKFLNDNGIADPGATLVSIQQKAFQAQAADATTAASTLQTRAIAEVADTPLTAGVFAWFDNTVERMRDLFVGRVRWVTVVGALLMTLLIPVDSLRLIKCLWLEPELRQALSQEAVAFAAANPEQPAPPSSAEIADLKNQLAGIRQQLKVLSGGKIEGCAVTELLPPPINPLKSLDRINEENAPGLLLTWFLLSLGAPFWYDALKNLIKLRPMLAGKEEKERVARATGAQ